MRNFYVSSGLGLPSCIPLKKCGADPLSAAIMGGAGLLSSVIGFESNESNVDMAMTQNQLNRQLQSKEADKARQWIRDEWNRQHTIQTKDWYNQLNSQEITSENLMDRQSALQLSNWQKQFNLQNVYNSPASQVQRLQSAGLNPALVLGGSGASGMMSAPSAPMPSASSPSPSVPVPNVPSVLAGTPLTSTPHREVTWATQLLGTIADVSDKLMKAGVNRTVIEQNQRTMESFVKKAQNEVEIQDLMKKSQSISNYIAERTKDFKVGKEYAELEKLWKEMTFIGSQIEVNRVLKQDYEADIDLKKMQEVLAQMQSNKAFQESELLSFQVSTYFEDFTNRQNLYKAQINAANASAYESTEAARLHIAQTAFTNMETDLSSLKKVAQTLENGIKSNEFKASSLGLEVDEASQLFKLIQEADKLDDIKDKWNLWNKVRKIKNLLGFQMSVGIHN